MDDQLGWYSGVEPTDVGDLTGVREQKTLIPSTKGVEVKIKKADNFVSQDNTYRMINLQLQIVNGIDAEGKYKGKVVFGKVTYYADPNKYHSEFFLNKQHLVQLKGLFKACNITSKTVDGHTLEQLEQCGNILCDITVKKGKRLLKDDELSLIDVSNTEEVQLAGLVKDKNDRWCYETLDNEARNFKPCTTNSSI